MPGRTMRQAGWVPSQNDGWTLYLPVISFERQRRDETQNPSLLERGISFRSLGLIAPQNIRTVPRVRAVDIRCS